MSRQSGLSLGKTAAVPRKPQATIILDSSILCLHFHPIHAKCRLCSTGIKSELWLDKAYQPEGHKHGVIFHQSEAQLLQLCNREAVQPHYVFGRIGQLTPCQPASRHLLLKAVRPLASWELDTSHDQIRFKERHPLVQKPDGMLDGSWRGYISHKYTLHIGDRKTMTCSKDCNTAQCLTSSCHFEAQASLAKDQLSAASRVTCAALHMMTR